MKPHRVVGGSPVFMAGDTEYLLSTHAIEQAGARGMNIHDLIDLLSGPEKVSTLTEQSLYFGDPVMRYIKGPWVAVIDYQAPIKIVVTVLFSRLSYWDAWNAHRAANPGIRFTKDLLEGVAP